MAARTFHYQTLSDAALVRATGAGATGAFNELYSRYGQKLFSYFFRMLWKNRELAEDQTQELFLKVLKHADSYDAARPFSTWLYSMAHNMCKNEYRKEEVRQRPAAIAAGKDLPQTEKALDLKRFGSAVAEAIANLTEEKHALFVLRFQEQLSVPEISAIMQVPEGTVKSRIFYLLKELKDELNLFKNIYLYP